MTIVIEHAPGRVDDVQRFHGPFPTQEEAQDYACAHLGGICGPWYWDHLVKVGEPGDAHA